MTPTSSLSLNDLETYDPRAPAPSASGERRFLCPLCGDDKPKNAVHRCFCLNSSNGLYHCKRCHCKGQLREHWATAPAKPPAVAQAQRLQRAFEIRPVHVVTPLSNTDPHLIWNASVPLEGTCGESYLHGRRISLETAQWSNVRHCHDWYGRETLVFPFYDPSQELVAVSGRTVINGGLDKPANGTKKMGAFGAFWRKFGPFHPDLPAIICEAPLDALSLAQLGFAALAVGGTSVPPWLSSKVAFRRVVLALDADRAGDEASEKLATHFAGYGARCVRLRPQGTKDWNAWLQEDEPGLRTFLERWLIDDALFRQV